VLDWFARVKYLFSESVEGFRVTHIDPALILSGSLTNSGEEIS